MHPRKKNWYQVAICVAAVGTFLSPSAYAAYFQDVTADWFGETPTDGWTNKVELCDLNQDGLLDVLLANGAAYNEPAAPEQASVWLNAGDHLVQRRDLLPEQGWWRAVKCADVDQDGKMDVLLLGTYQSQTRLYHNQTTDATQDPELSSNSVVLVDQTDTLPQMPLSAGDVELADFDQDGKLDILLATWGTGDPFTSRGGPRLWMQREQAFVDETEARLPTSMTGFTWDAEALDLNNDAALDILVSCKVCNDAGLILINQGKGIFADESGRIVGTGNNYEFAPTDIDHDGDFDLMTINDGPNLQERLLFNSDGYFTEFTPSDGFLVAGIDDTVNTGEDDNLVLWSDFDNDGDADAWVGSLSGADRILWNDNGRLLRQEPATDGPATGGTLGAALADLNADGKDDLVMGQGEAAFEEHFYLGQDVAVDTQKPIILQAAYLDEKREHTQSKSAVLQVRVHDNKAPYIQNTISVTAQIDAKNDEEAEDAHTLFWAGEWYWRLDGVQEAALLSARSIHICATDAANNQSCQDINIERPAAPPDEEKPLHCQNTNTTSVSVWAFLLVGIRFLRKNKKQFTKK